MSYNTVEEANGYVTAQYISTDESRVRWESFSDEDKQVLLTRAHDVIDSLPLTGRKTSVDQPDAFPRCPYKGVPDAVKSAECELALSLSDEAANASLDDYRKMVDYGIQSYSIGNFSETLLSYSKNSVEIKYGLNSSKAKQLLTPWLTGGFRIG